MATISNTPRPGYVWDSTDNVWYPIGVGGHSHSEIAKTIADAKGDLIVGTAADTVDRLAVGNNGESLVADSSTSTGLRWQGLFGANKNKIINGDFKINQRAFTTTTTDGTFGFDRWKFVTFDGTCTYSTQAFSPGAAPVTGYEGTNYARIVTSGQTLVSAETSLRQSIEDVRTVTGTTTISFWAQAGSGAPKIAIEFQQDFGSGGSGSVNTYAGSVTLSTSWTRYSVTFSVPSISGKTIGASNAGVLALWISAGSNSNTRTGSLGIQSNTFNIWGVQVEAGSVATPFQTATGTLQGELAACQRYYEVGSSVDGWSGYAVNANTYYLSIPFKVQKRTSSPTMTTTISQNIGSASVISQSEYGFRSSGTATATVNSAYFIFSAWNASAEL